MSSFHFSDVTNPESRFVITVWAYPITIFRAVCLSLFFVYYSTTLFSPPFFHHPFFTTLFSPPIFHHPFFGNINLRTQRSHGSAQTFIALKVQVIHLRKTVGIWAGWKCRRLNFNMVAYEAVSFSFIGMQESSLPKLSP